MGHDADAALQIDIADGVCPLEKPSGEVELPEVNHGKDCIR
jgi:hypothetical protein